MKLIVAITMVCVTMIDMPDAQASRSLDAYTECWANAATSYLDRNGVEEVTLDRAVQVADAACAINREAAIRQSGGPEVADMRRYMEVQLYNANPIPEPTLAAQAKEGYDPSKSTIYRPRNPRALFNKGFAWLCMYPSDVGKFRNLMAAGEHQAALNMRGCIAIDEPVEVIRTDSIGDYLIQVSYVLDGQTIDLWTEKGFFRDRRDWMILDCQSASNSYSKCSDLVG